MMTLHYIKVFLVISNVFSVILLKQIHNTNATGQAKYKDAAFHELLTCRQLLE